MICIRIILITAVVFVCLAAIFIGCDDDDDSDDSGNFDDDAQTTDDDDDDSNDDDTWGDDDHYSYDDDDDFQTIPEADPAKRGPFDVGNRTYIFVDSSRNDPATDGPRTLVTEVWYPALLDKDQLTPGIVREFFGQWDDLALTMLADMGAPPEELANFDNPTGSYRDAPRDKSYKPYPLILFSHGNAGLRFQNYTMCEYLASHGFIVAAPDHTGNSLFAPLEGEPVIFDENLVFISYWQRKADLSFLIDTFEGLSFRDPDHFWTGMVDIENIGSFGHSFGGTVVAETTREDQRIRATIDMAGFMFPWGADDYAGDSMMWMVALQDDTLGDATMLMRLDYAILPPPKFKLEFKDAGHYTFTDACILIPSLFGDGDGCGTGTRRFFDTEFDFISHEDAFKIINPYATAFFGYRLHHQKHMVEYLEENHFSEWIYYQTEWNDWLN